MQTGSNIAVIGNYWFPDKPGGLDRYVYELIYSLEKPRNRIEFFGVGLPENKSTSSIVLTNLAQPNTTFWKRLYSAYQNSSSIQSSQLDAVNIHFAPYGLATLPHLPKDVPTTCTFHGPWAFESRQEGGSRFSIWLKEQVEKTVYRHCDRFIVLSEAFGNILNQEFCISWDNIHIIPGGVNVDQFKPSLTREEARTNLGWPRDRFLLFTPRRLVNRMGLDKLLLAIAQLKPSYPDIWLAIAGKGPLRQQLELQVHQLGLDEQVKFLGFLPDEQLPVAYQAADLTIMPSQGLEGFGLVLLESLACGTPTLCTPVGGMPEVIHPFSPHLITSDTTENSIRDCLKAVLDQPSLLPDEKACRDYAVENFSWDKISSRVKAVLIK